MNTRISSAVTIDDAKLQAKRLVARLSILGVALKRTQALEAVAAVHNFPDWNRFQAKLAQLPGSSDVSQRAPATSDSSPDTAVGTGRPQDQLIVLPSGFGKTSVMAMLFADAMLANRMPIWISGGAGDPMPSFPRSHQRTITKLDLCLGDNGSFSGFRDLDPGTRGIYISLDWGFFESVERERSTQIKTEALASVLNVLHDLWIGSGVDPCKLVLIDEIPMVDLTNDLIYRQSKSKQARNCQLVMGLQHLPEEATAAIERSGLDFNLITVPQAFQSDRSDLAYWAGRQVMINPISPEIALQALDDPERTEEAMVRLTLLNLIRRDIDVPRNTPRQKLIGDFMAHFRIRRFGHQRIIEIQAQQEDLEADFLVAMRRAPDLLVLIGDDSEQVQSVMARARTLGCDVELKAK